MAVDGDNPVLLKSSGDLQSNWIIWVKGPPFPVWKDDTEMG